MYLTCLCPSYFRPHALATALALFERQTYPKEKRFFLALDDSGKIHPEEGENWKIISVPTRYPSLSAKYNAMLEMLPGSTEGLVVWDDDDLYLNRHLEAVALALQEGPWAHPQWVYSTYQGLACERAVGRFHGALALRLDACRAVGGWPDTRRADYDQQMLARLQETYGSPVHYDRFYGPTYAFHWLTRTWHSQWFMRGPDDEGWYDRVPIPAVDWPVHVRPELDRDVAELVLELEESTLPCD
jgi:hypothetical protein